MTEVEVLASEFEGSSTVFVKYNFTWKPRKQKSHQNKIFKKEFFLNQSKPIPAFLAHLEVWREVAVGFILIRLVQVVLIERQDEVVPVPVAFPAAVPALCVLWLALTRPARLAFCIVHRPVLHPVPALLWSRDEEGVHPEVKHFVLERQQSEQNKMRPGENQTSWLILSLTLLHLNLSLK